MSLLFPKKTKHRKWQKGRARTTYAGRGNDLAFGQYGLKSTSESWVTSRQIEACRRVIVRSIRKRGKMWIRIFPDRPVTKKGNEVPMGGGKGNPEYFVAPVKPGTILFELDGIDEEAARAVLAHAGHKLPVKTKFVIREF